MQRVRTPVLATAFLLSVAAKLLPYVLNQFGMSIDPQTTVYPWNFSPILPLCLFGAAVFADRAAAFVVPLAAWLVGDLGILLLTGKPELAFYSGQWVIYLSFAMVTAIGLPLRGNRGWWHVAGTGLLGATAFFLVTNFAVWAYGGGLRFPLTPEGLIDCYVFALPFFRNSLISVAVFLPLLFSRVTLTAPAGETQPNLATQAG